MLMIFHYNNRYTNAP